MKLKNIIPLLILALLLACAKDKGPLVVPEDEPIAENGDDEKEETSDEENPDEETETYTFSFKDDIQPIFNQNCVTCHGEFHQLNLESCCAHEILTTKGYVNTSSPEDSPLYREIKHPNPRMPPANPLSESDVDKILTWIKEGAKNN
ncbi:cytochrome c [Cytophagaceae bacterium ABcell3]|nr:cytochrome c [Cytophagaceae bacterium ABcell3]